MKPLIQVIKPELAILKIIPHRSVLNSNTRKLQSSLHELLSVKQSKRYSIERYEDNGFYLAVRPNPSYWWVSRITSSQIEFYLVAPKSYIESLKIKLRNFEQWKNCTIEDDQEIEFPDELNTDLFKLAYTQHDMFSLDFDYSQQNTPIRDLLTISNELKDDEELNLFIHCEPITRRKWAKISGYGWDQWNKGKFIYRNDLDFVRLFNSFFHLIAKVIAEIKALIDDMIKAVEHTFFRSYKFEDQRRSGFRIEDPGRQRILDRGGPSKRTQKKRTMQVYKTHIRYTVTSTDPLRRDILARSVENALSELNGDNELKSIKITFKSKQELNNLRNWKVREVNSNLMSIDEIGKLCQLPTREVQEEFSERLEFNHRIEVEIPKIFLDSSGIYAGTTQHRENTYNVHIPIVDRDMLFTPRAFVGSPRMGKDQAAINLIVEANLKHKIGAVIPDVIDERNGHRGMADAIRDHLPPENIIDLNLGDFNYPIYLGLNSLGSDESNQRIIYNRIAQELTNFLMGDDKENHQTREYLREFAKATGGDLIGIKLMCLSSEYRSRTIQQMKSQGMDTLAIEGFHELSEGKQSQISAPILVRLGELLGDEFLKPIFGQRMNPKVNLKKWMAEGKVVIFRIPSRDLGEMAVETITYWIILTTFLTRLQMPNNDKGVFIVLNEPHQFLSKGLIHFCKRLLAEGPKYRIAPIFLMHNFIDQLPRDFSQILLSSSINWHIFKNTNENVYQALRPYLEPVFTPDEAMKSTARYHFIACWMDPSGEYQPAFMVKAPDLVGKRYESKDNSFLTKNHSREYGRPVEEVLNEIQERQRIIYRQKASN